jgi:superfamily II DNA helicase RecQ
MAAACGAESTGHCRMRSDSSATRRRAWAVSSRRSTPKRGRRNHSRATTRAAIDAAREIKTKERPAGTNGRRQPKTIAELSSIPGVGPAKLERYGPDVLAALAAA